METGWSWRSRGPDPRRLFPSRRRRRAVVMAVRGGLRGRGRWWLSGGLWWGRRLVSLPFLFLQSSFLFSAWRLRFGVREGNRVVN